MDANSTIARPAYFLAALLFFVPLADIAASVWPFHFALEQWRFGTIGAFSNYTLVPLAGVFLALVTARTNNHRITRRVFGWLCAVFAATLTAFMLIFLLDYFQTRSIVHSEYRHTMAIAMTTATVKLGLTIIALALFAPAGITGPKRVWKETSDPERSSTPLIPIVGATRHE